MKGQTLSIKETLFLELLVGECAGNATTAVLGAGYTANRKSAAEIGSRLLRKVKITQALCGLLKSRTKASIADAAERDERLTHILRNSADEGQVIAAIKELNKVSGRHSVKHIVDLHETLSDIIAGSRRPAIRDVTPVGLRTLRTAAA